MSAVASDRSSIMLNDHKRIDTNSKNESQENVAISSNTNAVESSTPFLTDAEKHEKVNQLAEQYNINQTKLMWKIDICVVPPLALLYFLSFLDRVNISNASVYGMSRSLNLHGNQFNIALTVFFVPYIFFEVLSNYVLKFAKPHVWLSGCIFCFGVVSIGMGFSKSFGSLVACRFLLGIFEAGTFPAIFYILSNFYAKHESQRRFSTFFSCTCLAGACGGAIAFRINDLNNVHGLKSWQWIFIIEGTFTAGLAFILFFIIPDFPEDSRFLKDNEREFLKEKLKIYGGDSGFSYKYTPKEVARVFKDPIIWLSALAYFGLIIPSYGYAYFATSIIKVMGYTGEEANRRSIYPWLVAFGYTIMISFISDRLKRRLPFAIFNSFMAIAGLAIVLGCKHNIQARYGGCFLAVTGLYSAMPSLICWNSLNLGGHLRKSVGSAWQIGFGNIGGIIATFIFLSHDAPRYVKGISISIAFVIFSMVMMCGCFTYYYIGNKEKQDAEFIEKFDGLTDREKAIKGDKTPYITYIY